MFKIYIYPPIFFYIKIVEILFEEFRFPLDFVRVSKWIACEQQS